MEYFKFEYKNVKKEVNFSNYESFVTNMKNYKYYLFDLALMRHDPLINENAKSKANNIIQRQKLLFFMPYPMVAFTFLYYHKKNLFTVSMVNRETKIVFNLFMMLIGVRILQKVLLKYEGDKLLIDIANNKAYSI